MLARFFRAGERVAPWAWVLAGASLFASAASIALDALRLYALVAAAAVTIAAWMLGGVQGRTRFLVANALMVVTLAGGLALGTRFTHFLALVLVGAITFWGNTHPLVALERPAARLGRSPARGGASPNREPAD